MITPSTITKPHATSTTPRAVKSNNALVRELRRNDEDYEFYPTTAAIVSVIYPCLDAGKSLLDVGAGNGNFFRLIDALEKPLIAADEYYPSRVCERYAIEKSRILIENMDKDIAVIGRDFFQQTLIDKKVDVIFSNPPYSRAEEWAAKIIRESNCRQAFIVMPVDKFKKSQLLSDLVSMRNARSECLFEYDYRDSEFRKARTTVGVFRICFAERYGAQTDPFDAWFDENFKLAEEEPPARFSERVEADAALTPGKNLIERLETLYTDDMEQIASVYRNITQMPSDILRELQIGRYSILKSLKLRLASTKNLYWKELFANLDVIINRLTHKSKASMLEKITRSTVVDFSADNAYAIVCWALKNANAYFDRQLIEVYHEITRQENVLPYKSNQRFNKSDFRYSRNETSNYKLDYRIILVTRSNCLSGWSGQNEGLDYNNDGLRHHLEDLLTIAHNLGFEPSPIPLKDWDYGVAREIKMKSGETFATMKIFKNGNIHIKFCIEFMKAFNLEAGRLLGWLKTPQQASDELDIPAAECLKYFKSNLSLCGSDLPLLEA